MGILETLGVGVPGTGLADHGDTDTVKQIVAELGEFEPARARFLAAFAYVLSRVAHADSAVCVNETKTMQEIVQKLGHLPEAQAALVVEIARNQAQRMGGTENYLVTREFREITTQDQRIELLDCLFAVAAADGAISTIEESQAGQIAKELGFTQPEYASVLSAHSDHRTVIQTLRSKRQP